MRMLPVPRGECCPRGDVARVPRASSAGGGLPVTAVEFCARCLILRVVFPMFGSLIKVLLRCVCAMRVAQHQQPRPHEHLCCVLVRGRRGRAWCLWLCLWGSVHVLVQCDASWNLRAHVRVAPLAFLYLCLSVSKPYGRVCVRTERHQFEYEWVLATQCAVTYLMAAYMPSCMQSQRTRAASPEPDIGLLSQCDVVVACG